MKDKIPQIDNATTLALISKYQQDGDIDARNQVLLGNIKLIYSIAHRYKKSLGNAFDDFVSEGVIGMIEAINKFDTKNYQNFSTYAYWHILKRVNGSNNMGTLNLPQHRIQIYQAYEKERLAMISRGESPSYDIIAKKIGVSDALLTDTINKKDDISIDYGDPADSSKARTRLMQRSVSSPRNLEEEITLKLDFEKTKNLINTILSKQEQDILRYRFGLDGEDPLTLQETSQHMNISTEYVRVLQNKSLLKLKKLLTKKW